ncbi:flagellar filament capping protein FliD [Roseospira visakhapatnamensis]|uniref:Flagellar hook-associated protein 2 n=1 Tax=Roseospira visakhapatnamensis TaxID=390880 RepID=A0A7W6RBM8_9PROT|nr:flagellar filament capping protein FliD [Roseospira visakhapatnamensis]MBB4265509.1 flagellar hook-associated protein 2 [Roseospira visakhapatnamensis]
MTTIVSSSVVTGSSGATYISGMSGLDTAALIQAAVEARMQPAYAIDSQRQVLDAKVAAFQELNGLLETLADSVTGLSGQADAETFAKRAAYLTSTLDTPANHLTATVADEAALGVYDIEVIQLAASHKVASAEQAGDAALGLNGSFSLAADGAAGATITVTADMTVSDVAAVINAASADTGVVATLVGTSDGNKTLVLSTVDTGVSMTAGADTGGVLTGLGLTAADGSFAHEVQAAQDAVLTVDGITVTSASNEIEDVVPGVSLSLYAATAGETITLEVGQDLGSVKESIEAFVEAFNAVRAFAITHQQTEEGVGAAEDAVLFADSTLKSVTADLYDAVGTAVEVDGVTHTLATLGITMGAGATLSIDEDKLTESLLQHADVVQAFFASTATSSSVDLAVISLPETVPPGDHTVDVTVDPGTGAVTAASIGGVALSVSGATLSGPPGTAYEGLRMVYTGTGGTSATLTVSQGLADQVLGMVDAATNDTDGLITTKLDGLDATIEDKDARRATIADRAADYEQTLILYYARLEEQIALAQTKLQYIEALFNNSDD